MQSRSLVLLVIIVLATWICGWRDLSTTPATAATPTTMTATTRTTTRAADEDYCFSCHEVQEGMSLLFKNDIHYSYKLSCADCHGGSPGINDMNLSKTPESGFGLRVTRRDVPLFCAGCHSNAKFMAGYKATLPTNQYALYSRSVHGTLLAGGNEEAAQCVDCHRVHDTRAVDDPLSSVHSRNITSTCAECHAETAALFQRNRPHRKYATCVTCHGDHDVQPATTALLTTPRKGCAKCHQANSDGAQAALRIADLLDSLEKAGPGSEAALERARRAVHSFSPAAVRRAINAPATKPASGDGTAPPAPSPAEAPTTAPTTAPAEYDCLTCHGPYDQLIKDSARYVAPSGETGSPHLFVPHDSKLDADIPACSNCHATHSITPVPTRRSIATPKAGIQWCYTTCHHDETLTSCKTCHP
jgi:hypothetical protein